MSLLAGLIKDLQRLSPSRLLRIVDLAEIQDGSLNDLAGLGAGDGNPAILDDTEVAMLLAVLPAPLRSEEHGPMVNACGGIDKGVGLHYSRFRAHSNGTTETYG